MMNFTRQLPNALTLINLCLGTMAIIAIMNDRIPAALLLMGGCLLADASDGLVARLLKVESNLGVHLDSLADVVSFGVLPGMMIYFLGTKYDAAVPGKTMTEILAVVLAASAGMRLARFNIDTRDRKYFWGLATPAGAIMVAGWLWADFIDKDYGIGFSGFPWLIVLLSVFLIVAYHLPLKLPNLKSPKQGFVTATFLIVSIGIGLFTIGPISLPLGVFLYVMLGLLNLRLKWY